MKKILKMIVQFRFTEKKINAILFSISANGSGLCDGGFYTQRILKTAIAKPVLPAGAVNLAVFLIWK